jgi:hypothetical protein
MSKHRFLDAQFSLLEVLDNNIIRQGSAQFPVELPLDTGMLELKGAEMRTLHGWSSFMTPHPPADSASQVRHVDYEIIVEAGCEDPYDALRTAFDEARYCRAGAQRLLARGSSKGPCQA